MTFVLAARATAIERTAIRDFFERARPTSLHLGIGQPNIDVHPTVRQALKASADLPAHYSPNAGMPELREAIATHTGCKPEEVMVTCGVQEALAVSVLGLVEANDEVLIMDPAFPAYANLVRAAGARPVAVTCSSGDGFQLDPDRIKAAITSQTRMLILNSPSNPTGAVYTPDAMRAIEALADEHGIGVVLDEIYEDLVYDGAVHTRPARAIRTGGLSKSHGMMGWRLGWLIAPAGVIERLTPLHQHLVTCASTCVQLAAIAALAHHEEQVSSARAKLVTQRDAMLTALEAIEGVRVPASQGALYMMLDVRQRCPESMTTHALSEFILEHYDVVTIPGSGFGKGGEGHLRLAYTVDVPTIEEAIARINQALNDVSA